MNFIIFASIFQSEGKILRNKILEDQYKKIVSIFLRDLKNSESDINNYSHRIV